VFKVFPRRVVLKGFPDGSSKLISAKTEKAEDKIGSKTVPKLWSLASV
jgi:hypothetical protein